MNIELEEFLEECVNTDPNVELSLHFYRDLEDEEKEKFNAILDEQGAFITSEKCNCCLELPEKQSYNIKRVKKY